MTFRTARVGPLQTFTATEGVEAGGEAQGVHIVVKAVCALTPITPGKE